jgi:hypothetical protein
MNGWERIRVGGVGRRRLTVVLHGRRPELRRWASWCTDFGRAGVERERWGTGISPHASDGVGGDWRRARGGGLGRRTSGDSVALLRATVLRTDRSKGGGDAVRTPTLGCFAQGRPGQGARQRGSPIGGGARCGVGLQLQSVARGVYEFPRRSVHAYTASDRRVGDRNGGIDGNGGACPDMKIAARLGEGERRRRA